MTKPKRQKRASNVGGSDIVPPRRDPTRWEREAFPAAIERQAGFVEPASVSLEPGKAGYAIGSQHDDLGGHTALLGCALGSRAHDWVHKAITDLMTAAGVKNEGAEGDQLRTNAALAFMSDVAPSDTIEATIAINAFAANELALLMMRRAAGATMLPQMVAYGNLASKFSTRSIQHIEALAKLRRGGEQVVKHVHVYEGGQAVVAGTINQHQGGGGKLENAGQSHAAAAIAGSAALPRPDPARDAMPVASDAERPMPDARRDESGGAEGQ